MSHNPPWKSEIKPYAPGQTSEFSDFVPVMGPAGGRVVVDEFILRIVGTVTVGTAAWDGRDVPRLVQFLSVDKRDNRSRWQLSGAKSRFASILLNGIRRHLEHGNVAVASNQTVDLSLIIPMAKRFVVRPKDFSLPADLFRKISVTWASLAQAQTGTTVLTAPTLNAYILANWHEENNVEFKAEDMVRSVDFASNTQGRLTPGGAIHDLFLMRETAGGGVAGGGDVITALTDVRIEDLQTPTLTRQDLLAAYTTKRNLGNTLSTAVGAEVYGEPAREGRMLPIVVADDETSLWDARVVENCKIDVGTGVAGLAAVWREVVPKSEADYRTTLANFGLTADDLRMKTAGKSRRGFKEGWTPRQARVGVWSGPLNKTA